MLNTLTITKVYFYKKGLFGPFFYMHGTEKHPVLSRHK